MIVGQGNTIGREERSAWFELSVKQCLPMANPANAQSTSVAPALKSEILEIVSKVGSMTMRSTRINP